jgi:uncharacterized membrane-anchored protein
MDMVKDEVIQMDRLSAIQESLLEFIHEEVVYCQQENIGMMDLKNPIETRNLK